MMNRPLNIIVLFFLIFLIPASMIAQTINGVQLDGSRSTNILTAVPFLLITPQARTSAMGNTGVAIDADANSPSINTAVIAFLPRGSYGFSGSFSPWLKSLVRDMSLSYLSAYYRINDRNTFTTSLRYFSIGKVTFTDENFQNLGDYNPNEFALDVGYARSLGPEFALGVNIRYINSNLVSGANLNNKSIGAGTAVAADVSAYYTKSIYLFGEITKWSLGMNATNIGTKLVYGNGQRSFFLPANLRIGSALKFGQGEHKLTIAFDVNKMLVPTQPIYDSAGKRIKGRDPDRSVPAGIFGSFSDAPGGISEELKEIGFSSGLEFSFKEKLFFRTGYTYQHPDKGGISFLSTGIGLKYNALGIDFSYLLGASNTNPLANTLRFTLQTNL